MSSVFFPFTNIERPIWPALFSLSVSEAPLPLAVVYRARLELVGRSLFSLLQGVVLLLGDCLLGLLVGEVLAAPYLLAPQHRDVLTSLVTPEHRLQPYYLIDVVFQSIVRIVNALSV